MKWHSLLLCAEMLLVWRVGLGALGPTRISRNEQVQWFMVLNTISFQVKVKLNSKCVLPACRLNPHQMNWGMRSGAGCGENKEREK